MSLVPAARVRTRPGSPASLESTEQAEGGQAAQGRPATWFPGLMERSFSGSWVTAQLISDVSELSRESFIVSCVGVHLCLGWGRGNSLPEWTGGPMAGTGVRAAGFFSRKGPQNKLSAHCTVSSLCVYEGVWGGSTLGTSLLERVDHTD